MLRDEVCIVNISWEKFVQTDYKGDPEDSQIIVQRCSGSAQVVYWMMQGKHASGGTSVQSGA